MAKNAQYKATGLMTEDGEEVYRKMTGGRGRPAHYVKRGDRYKKYTRPISFTLVAK